MEQQAGYDRAITLFSPDGRLFQVEYARQAVQRGSTVVGMKTTEGVLLLGDRFITNPLIEGQSIKKIYQIDDHIAIATAGLVADARVLIDRARIIARINHSVYDEPITVEVLANNICDIMQSTTQYGGSRPFGTSLLIAGVDDAGMHLFETDPSGALIEYKATAVGRGRDAVFNVFWNSYKETLTLKEALVLGLKALEDVEGIDKNNIDIGVIGLDKVYRKITPEEIIGTGKSKKGEK